MIVAEFQSSNGQTPLRVMRQDGSLWVEMQVLDQGEMKWVTAVQLP